MDVVGDSRQKITSLRSNTKFKPYLGLRSRLSQVWFNRWSLLLFLIFVRVMLAAQSLDSDLSSARREALSACTGVESMGSAMASMPFYMSKGVNEMAASGIEAAVQGLQKTLLLMIKGIQEMVIFVVHIFTSTYLCLIMLAINASLGTVLDAAKEITEFVDKTMDSMVKDLSDGVASAQKGLNDFLAGVNKVGSLFGEKLEFEVKVPLDKLRSFSIPNDVGDKIEAVKKKVPNFEEVQDAADNAIRIPFQILHNAVNTTLGVYEFNRAVFPVPQKERLTFCSDGNAISNFFDGLEKTIKATKTILIALILASVVMIMIPVGWLEIRSYRRMVETARNLSKSAPDHAPSHEYLLDASGVIARPFPTRVGMMAGEKVGKNKEHRVMLIRWCIDYISSPPVLFVLSLGIAGLLGVLAQYILLKKVEAKTPELAAEVGAFAGIVAEKLTDASEKWAVSTNAVISDVNSELNEKVFGWVKDGTESVNKTLNVFVEKMQTTLDDLFGGTPFEKPIEDVINCLIGLKVQGLQKGLTWVNEHAEVNFPLLPKETFSLGALESLDSDDSSSSFLADPGSETTDKISNTVGRMTKKWRSMLLEEALISLGILCVWLVVVLFATGRVAFHWTVKEKSRGKGGENPNWIVFNNVRDDDDATSRADSERGFNRGFHPSPPPMHHSGGVFAPQTGVRRYPSVSSLDDSDAGYYNKEQYARGGVP